jgi:nucleoside-diphosphate-sugar epimerase
MGNVALITGGNGITGSAIIEYLVKNTTKDDWSEIIVTSRSPFKALVHDPRIKFIALDFTQEPSKLAVLMQDSCASVTHAYFSSYVHKDDFVELNTANQSLFENFLQALLHVTPKLENCTLQTGGKYYNVHLRPIPSPAREEDPREGRWEDNFYFPQEDTLAEMQKGKEWSWNVIRPEAIIGHTGKPNGMNSALTYALYLLACKELGEDAPMPTNQLYFNGTDDCSDSGLIAEFTIWASTNPKCKNQAFNVVNGDYFAWRYLWPRIATYLGANASPDQTFKKPAPQEGQLEQEFTLAEWSKDKRAVWDRLCDKAGVPEAKATWDAATWQYQDWVFQRSWSATLSFNKARKFGWTGFRDSYESITDTFAIMKKLKQIP